MSASNRDLARDLALKLLGMGHDLAELDLAQEARKFAEAMVTIEQALNEADAKRRRLWAKGPEWAKS